MRSSHRLGELQHAIMRVLWGRGEASVAQVRKALEPRHPRALTTIATMLAKMERKGVCAHRRVGRLFLYRPTVTEAEVRRSMVSELTEKLFGGDARALVAHLLTEEELDAGDLERLRGWIAERRGEARDGDA